MSTVSSSSSSVSKLIVESWMVHNPTFIFPSNDNDSSSSSSRDDDDDLGRKVKQQQQQTKSTEERIHNLWKRFQNINHIIISSFFNTTTTTKKNNNHYHHLDELIHQWWQDKIVTMHSERTRAYHTLCHLEEMFGFYDIFISLPYTTTATTTTNELVKEDHSSIQTIYLNEVDQACIALAIFFHDIIYNVKSNTNEEDSAKLLEKFLTELSQQILQQQQQQQQQQQMILNNNKNIKDGPHNDKNAAHDWNYFIERTSCYILATKSHNHNYPPPPSSSSSSSSSLLLLTNKNDHCNILDREMRYQHGLSVFLDVDMAVLGKSNLAYQHYAAAIRIEYQHVPRNIYCEKRSEILESFFISSSASSSSYESNNNQQHNKKTKFIFATIYMRDALEEQARTNLTLEIQSLRQGIILQEK